MPPDPPQHELDLLALLRSSRYDVAVTRSEAPADRAARIEREKAGRDHRHRKDLMIARAGVVAVLVALLGTLVVAVVPVGSVDDKARARTILTLIVGGFIGFLTGRQFPAESAPDGHR